MTGAERIEYHDRGLGITRAAWVKDGRLEACLFVAPKQPDLARQWLRDLFALGRLDGPERAAILAGRAAGEAAPECGALVCSCYAVGLAEIESAIADGQATTVGQVGRLLQAGTGCGSCMPEFKQILTWTKPAEAA